MKISYHWLKRYLSTIPEPQKTAEILTLAGLEVEEIEQKGSDFKGIVVGRVLEVKPHPNADRLVVCTVDTGDETPVPIVCGAPNVASGQHVVVAKADSILPVPLPDGSPFKIRKTKIRGEHSAGMICAEDELGIGDDHTGILVLDQPLKPGTPFSTVADSFHDVVFEVGLTPNRPDATCHLGVARDVSAVSGSVLLKPFDKLPNISKSLKDDAIRITDTDKCHRYVGIVIRNISVGESPKWLKNLLMSIGLRPVNNVVDITNFVLHELGQPLHAFDLDLLHNEHIHVQSFDREVRFTTLDAVERSIPAGSLFICDGEKPVALAGIMGGINSEISEKTKNILIESAWFEPTGIRKTARNLSLQTDSSYRFERGVDPEITKIAALRCAELVLELCGGEPDGVSDIHPVKTVPVSASLRHGRLDRILGVALDANTVSGILEKLEIKASYHENFTSGPAMASSRSDSHNRQPSGGPYWTCTIPTFRPDITSEIDLIEEVARIYDYNNIPDPDRINIAQPEPIPFTEAFREKVRNAALGTGLTEIYTNSLLPERFKEMLGGEKVVISTLNPITKDQALLRTRLVYGFLRSAAYNFNRGAASVRFFEIGNIFQKDNSGGRWIPGIHEATHLHIGISGRNHNDHWQEPSRPFHIFDLKAHVEAILNHLDIHKETTWRLQDGSLQLLAIGSGKKNDGIILGTLSPVNNDWKKITDIEEAAFSAEVDIGLLEKIAKKSANKVYRPVSKFPSFEFDLALVVDKKIPAGDLEDGMRCIAGNQLISVHVFDVFEGGSLKSNQKSIAYRLTFQDNDKTLTINDIDPVIKKILNKLGTDFSAELRS